MTQTTLSIFETEGTRREVSGNKPFLLNDPEDVWLVMNGKIDVFVVRTENGAPRGPRKYMFSIESGQALWSFDLKDADQEFGLLAVGAADTHLQHLPRARLQADLETPGDFEEIL